MPSLSRFEVRVVDSEDMRFSYFVSCPSNMQSYNEIKPQGFLANFIQCFWKYESQQLEQEYTILPDGCFDLIVILKDGNVRDVKLTGVWTKPIHVTIPACTNIFAIRFKLLASEYILKHPINSIVDSDIYLPSNFWEIDKMEFADFKNTVSVFTGRINLSLKHLKKIDERKLILFEHIYQAEILNVNRLAEKVFWNSRQINRYFTRQFGFPLKTLLNILRLKASYHHIAAGKLTPEKEYFDQAHFVKEIKKYTGVSPRILAQNKNDRFLQLATLSDK
jgi:AraC-like DNA-binding protein